MTDERTAAQPLSRESGLALIEDAQRWQRAYERERDRLDRVRALLATGAPVQHVIEVIQEVEDVGGLFVGPDFLLGQDGEIVWAVTDDRLRRLLDQAIESERMGEVEMTLAELRVVLRELLDARHNLALVAADTTAVELRQEIEFMKTEEYQRRVLTEAFKDAADEADCLRAALEKIAGGRRPDGTWNYSREACEQIAKEALGA